MQRAVQRGAPRKAQRTESGYSLVALLAALTIALIMMSAALPTWRYIMKNEREEELLFRGGQIADAIQAYQGKNGNALPVSLEILVKGHYLRKAYKDPMTKDGRWRFLHPGEVLPGGAPAGQGGAGGGKNPTGIASAPPPGEPPATRPVGPAPSGTTVGPIIGVASYSTEKSLRLFNGRTRYSEWSFIAGQPRVVGRQMNLPPVVSPSPQASSK